MLAKVAIQAFKPASKLHKEAGGGGLLLFIQLNGSRIGCLVYHFDGKQKLLSGAAGATCEASACAWALSPSVDVVLVGGPGTV